MARVVAGTDIGRREHNAALGWAADLQLAGRLDGEELLGEGFNLGGVLQQLVQDEVQQALAVVAASAVHQLQQRLQFEACTQHQHRTSTTRILCKSLMSCYLSCHECDVRIVDLLQRNTKTFSQNLG